MVLLQGCAVIDGAVPAATGDSGVSEVARVVVRNAANLELYVGTLPLTLVLKPGANQEVEHPYAVRIELHMPKQSREFVLHHGRSGWLVANGDEVGKRRVPNGVLSVSSQGVISAFTVDELTPQSDWLSTEHPMGRDDLIVVLTDARLAGNSRGILSTCLPRTASC